MWMIGVGDIHNQLGARLHYTAEFLQCQLDVFQGVVFQHADGRGYVEITVIERQFRQIGGPTIRRSSLVCAVQIRSMAAISAGA